MGSRILFDRVRIEPRKDTEDTEKKNLPCFSVFFRGQGSEGYGNIFCELPKRLSKNQVFDLYNRGAGLQPALSAKSRLEAASAEKIY